jgi:hypothetical protein
VTPQPGADINARWLAELAALGYRDRDVPVDVIDTPIGTLDRDAAVGPVLARLAAARSAWNAADIRGEVERLIAGEGIVADAAVRAELAEDLTARALQRCVPLLGRDGVPEHIRARTSQPVLDVEADLAARLAARASEPSAGAPQRTGLAADAVLAGRLDSSQALAVAALAADRSLIVLGRVWWILVDGGPQPDLDRGDVDGAPEDELAFVGAHCDRAEVLELVDRSFHGVALLVGLRVERRWPSTRRALRGAGLLLVGLLRNRRGDPASTQVSADLPVGVGLVGQQSVGAVRAGPARCERP